jgi:hypothetical protein
MPALAFSKAQAYDFPHMGSHCAVTKSFEEDQKALVTLPYWLVKILQSPTTWKQTPGLMLGGVLSLCYFQGFFAVS